MRKLLTTLAALALMLTLTLPGWAAGMPLNTAVFTIGSTSYTFNGQVKQMDVAPVIVPPGRTMLPIRYVAYGMGIPESDITYLAQSTVPGYSQDQEVDITQNIEYKGITNVTTSVILYNTSDLQDAVVLINRNSSYPISFAKQYGVAPQIINGRLMVPLRAVVQVADGGVVNWNGNTNQVTIESPQTSH